MTGFTLLDHTSEIGFEATGTTLDTAFAHAGQALFETMTDIDDLSAEDDLTFSVESENLEALLFDYVDELIYIAQAKQFLIRSFDITISETADGYRLDGTGYGEPIREDLRLQEVKAPTYSDIVVEETGEGWTLRMFLDV